MRAQLPRAALTFACALVAASCGGSVAKPEVSRPPAPEPANSPPLSARPAGRVVSVGGMPEGVVAAANVVGLAVRGPAGVVLLDGARGKLVARIALPGAARHLALAGGGRIALVPEEPADHLAEILIPSGRVSRSTQVGRNPHDAIEAGGRTIVSDELGGRVSVLSSGRTLTTLGGFVQPAGIAAAQGRFGVIDVRANTLAIYDLATLRLVATLPAGAGPTHVVADGHGRLDVVDTRGGAILVFRLRPTPVLLARVSLGGRPYGVAVDTRRDRLWVTLTARNRLVGLRLDGTQPRQIEDLPTVRQPNSVAFDAATGRVYVAGASARGALQILAQPLAGR